MKFSTHKNSGFTLLELLVAVTITAIIMVVLLSMTVVVADAWKNGNNKIFTNNEARAGLGRLSTDLENAVFHDIPGAEWFVSTQDESYFSDVPKPANSTWLMFYTIPTDRQIYEKVAGSTEYNYSRPIPGNVVTMSYKIVPQDPISISGSTGKSEFMLYGLYRTSPGNANLAGSNPAKETFDNVLGTSNLKAYWGSNASKSAEKEDVKKSSMV